MADPTGAIVVETPTIAWAPRAMASSTRLRIADVRPVAISDSMDPDPSTLNVGDYFTVTVEADCLSNAVAGGPFFEGKSITESVVMRAE